MRDGFVCREMAMFSFNGTEYLTNVVVVVEMADGSHVTGSPGPRDSGTAGLS
jgi:hypothetical protein